MPHVVHRRRAGVQTVVTAVLLACALACPAAAQQGGADHPRLLAGANAGPQALRDSIARDQVKAGMLASLTARVRPYVDRHKDDPAWIVSRLQMYWQSHSTQVFVKNGFYDHAAGRAPVPTVRFTGARDHNTAYFTPRLEDVKPYMGENDQLYLQSKSAPGQPWEWVGQSKTGTIIQNINMRIAELARDAAFLYWYTGDEAYARFAYDIFDTYMTGLYFRETPEDLNHGHDQTLTGLQSFEVIHEDIAGPLAETYDFMHGYVARRAGEKRQLHDAAFKKWADLIIANGVPWNNWNLIQARFVLQIAAALDGDDAYADRRGRQYYVQAVIEGKGARQWGLKRLAEYGYDSQSAIWNESPGYSNNVANDYLECLELLERVSGIDLLPQLPVLPRAAAAMAQYLLPNGRTVAFGDARYDFLRTAATERLLAYAERHGQDKEAREYAALLAALRSASGANGAPHAAGSGVAGLFGDRPKGSAGHGATTAGAPRIQDYQTPTFYAPNAGWLIQRNGYDSVDAASRALVVSQAGSAGNHAHANGIAMELYAQGLSLAPESGRGSGYLQNDHLEYYSQFPSHNTVVVDGLSTYPSMKSNHPLSLQAVYPQPGSPAAAAFPWATFSDVAFTEPETDAQQQRVLGTVRLGNNSGYFVDIFRSRRRNGKDRYHDYIYHNLGQTMRFERADGQPLAMEASDRLAFADGDLIGYDYWQQRKSLKSVPPLRARFELTLPQRTVSMTAWLQGDARREYFSVQAPPSTAWAANMLPEGLDRMPLQTLVVRHAGPAWQHPFTAVLEAESTEAPASVLAVEEVLPREANGHAVGLRVSTAGNGRQTIMSTDGAAAVYAHAGQRLVGRYGIVAERDGVLEYLFLGQGSEVAGQGYAIASDSADASAAVWRERGTWFYTGSRAARLRVPADAWPRDIVLNTDGRKVRLRSRLATAGGKPVRIFDMPPLAATPIR